MRTWTEKDKKRQACIARQNRPWQNSTGPRTEQGKATSKMNAFQHGFRSAEFDRLKKLLRLQRLFVRKLKSWDPYLAQLHNPKIYTPPTPTPANSTNELLSRPLKPRENPP